ncbi:hypothetical protein MNBD_ACTINO02-2765, partial [hydrothermal vent metagenome]
VVGFLLLKPDGEISRVSEPSDSSPAELADDSLGEPTETPSESVDAGLVYIETFKLTDRADGHGARPEIASNGEYIYIVYLGDLTTQRSHKVRIYDLDFNLLGEKVLATGTSEYGGVTDIRISRDDMYVYSFYEMADKNTGATLFGAKYRMDGNFTKVAESDGPIVTSAFFFDAVDGEETLNDPASIVVNGKVYLMTQITYKRGGVRNAKTLYKLRELSSDLSEILDTREIDLSGVMTGWAGLANLLEIGGVIYTIQGSLVSYPSGFSSDLRMVRFDTDWEFNQDTDVFALTNTDDTTETMPVGARYVDDTLFVSFRVGDVTVAALENPTSRGELWLNMYNNDFELIDSVQVSTDGVEGEHASVEVIGDYVYVAYGGSTSDSVREDVYVSVFRITN